MANSATPKTPLPIRVWGCSSVTPVEVVLDSTGSDLTIYTPSAGKMAAIVGLNYAETTAHTLTFTTGSDTQFVLEMGANSGISQGIGREIFFPGQPGEALKIQTSAAITDSMMFYVIEGEQLTVGW